MRVRAVVDQVRALDVRIPGEPPLTAVSLEGFSVLVPGGAAVPEVGTEVEAVVSVRWGHEKGKRPSHWLRSFQPAV
jgi:Ni,Fe-hydrogenase III small subunit